MDIKEINNEKEKLAIEPVLQLKNNFTYEFWVRPESKHEFVVPSNNGIAGLSNQRYVIAPGYPDNLNQAGVGLSIGMNGISVFEHSYQHLPAILVYKAPIENWTHVALVISDKRPYLFVNGNFVQKGLRSEKMDLLASGIIGKFKGNCDFVGQIRELRIWDYPLNYNLIRHYMGINIIGNEPGLYFYSNGNDVHEAVPNDNKLVNIVVDKFEPKLTLGIIHQMNAKEGKENLIKNLINDPNMMKNMQIVANNESWGVPVWTFKSKADFYRSIDYLLIPNLIDEDITPFMEALACGRMAITPPIGKIPQYPHIEYEQDNIHSLKSTILSVQEDLLNHKRKISNYARNYFS